MSEGVRTLFRQDGVFEIILTEKHVGNRFDREGLAALSAAFLHAEQAGSKAVLLSHEGDSFCLGGCLGDARKQDAGSVRAFADSLSRVLFQIYYAPVPVLAALEGNAEGGGLSLVQACDMAAASRSALFGIPEMETGMSPVISMCGANRVIPEKKMLKMALLAQRITAEEAEACGLITEAVAPGTARKTCEGWMEKFTEKNPSSISTIRRLRRDLDGGAYFRQVNTAAALLPGNLLHKDTWDMLDRRENDEKTDCSGGSACGASSA